MESEGKDKEEEVVAVVVVVVVVEGEKHCIKQAAHLEARKTRERRREEGRE